MPASSDERTSAAANRRDFVDAALAKARARRDLPAPSERRQIREAAGLSIADVALAVGVSVATVSRWETADIMPRGRILIDYLDLLRELSALSSNGSGAA